MSRCRANLREGVIWITPADEDKKELVQEMANDYVRMACAESAKMQVPQAIHQPSGNKRAFWWSVAASPA